VPISFHAKAPGSKMIAGEYAVLHEQPAIACAIDRYITCELTPKDNDAVNIYSDLGEYHSKLDELQVTKPFDFVLAAISSLRDHISSGFTLTITSDLSTQFGLGSSAAATLSVLGCLHAWLNLPSDKPTLISKALEIIQQIQKAGSGADVAASAHGGMIYYRMAKQHVEPLNTSTDFHFIYSGIKASTKQAIQFMRKQHHENPEKFDAIFHNIGQQVEQAKKSIQENNLCALGEALNSNAKMMKELNVSCEAIDLILDELRQSPNIKGAKISGAGFGDCVLALGQLDDKHFPSNQTQKKLGIQQLPIKLSHLGLTVSTHE
jgi:mevalonate kinase